MTINDDLIVTVKDKAFKSFMKDLKVTTANLEPAFRKFGDYLKKETDEQFSKEIDPDGKKWSPLKESTLKRKKTRTILRETGKMVDSYYYEVQNNSFEYGLKSDIYIHHHYGTRKMAKRRVIGLTNDRYGELNKLVILQIKRVKAKHKSSKKGKG